MLSPHDQVDITTRVITSLFFVLFSAVLLQTVSLNFFDPNSMFLRIILINSVLPAHFITCLQLNFCPIVTVAALNWGGAEAGAASEPRTRPVRHVWH